MPDILGDVIVGVILLAVIIGAAAITVRDRKKGICEGCCGGRCANCKPNIQGEKE